MFYKRACYQSPGVRCYGHRFGRNEQEGLRHGFMEKPLKFKCFPLSVEMELGIIGYPINT